jgi:branched-chain amino acid transport system substrate-binding protein
MKKAGLLALVAVLATVAASVTGAGAARVAAGPTCSDATVGFMGPVTGPAASIGKEQVGWFKFGVQQFNKANKTNFKFIIGDTQLNPANAQTVAAKFHSNQQLVAIVGPAGSQEVEAIGPIFQAKKIAFISPSATRTTLTLPGKYPTFFRVVPKDDDQGATIVNLLVAKNVKKVFIVDDQESYSTGLADKVQGDLKARGVTVDRQSIDQKTTDFSSLVAKITPDTDAVFLPWQIAANAQLFGQQMKEQGKTAAFYGSDGLFSPDFKIEGAIVTSFAPDIKGIAADAPLVAAYTKQYGKFGTFGPPNYLAAQILLTAMKQACADGKISRAEVLSIVPKIQVKNSLLGGTFKFNRNHEPVGAKFYAFVVTNGQLTLL